MESNFSEVVAQINKSKEEVHKVIVGQQELVDSLYMGILTGGHLLLEGLPGLAKTLSVSTVAKTLSVQFQRIQFTPDLLPSDLIGTMIFNPSKSEFDTKKGPIFTNLLLADEINRAPAKVQSALLEAMAEKQVTIGDTTHKLDRPFLVLATQNPVEQEGTYSLPEAQLDRFMFKVVVGYPTKEEELQILKSVALAKEQIVDSVLTKEQIIECQNMLEKVKFDEALQTLVVNIVWATRNPGEFGLGHLESFIKIGGSPRATLSLVKAAKASAFLDGRDYVTAEDIKKITLLVLRHRLILNFEAHAEGVTSEEIIKEILGAVEI
ncbi:MAG: AAA family ATPase [Bdellovibrionales bacterium]